MRERYINRLPLSHPQLGTWPTTQACALTGNRTIDLLESRLALNPLNHTNQGCTKINLKKCGQKKKTNLVSCVRHSQE